MKREIFLRNKKAFLAYTQFRKEIFCTLSPKEGEIILYLLPWLLSVNHPKVPGYTGGLKKGIAVYGIHGEKEILSREKEFRQMFGVEGGLSLISSPLHSLFIQGVYTIGSVGTMNQTSLSDCDIWICVNENDFDRQSWGCLIQKVNLIKDWLDENIKMPTYFFISDAKNIARAQFGPMDEESSGSAQGKILVEEFYRTIMLIAGKIPLWWLSFDPAGKVDYQKFVKAYKEGQYDDFDCIDLGNLEWVDKEEFFGAALWQFNKALTHPLKSVIKMLILSVFLAYEGKELLCDQFRRETLTKKEGETFTDPATFTMRRILEHYRDEDPETRNLINTCFYLIIREGARKLNKERDVIRELSLKGEEIEKLDNFSHWPLEEHLALGERAFNLLVRIYRQIKPEGSQVKSVITQRDMTAVGRKLTVFLGKRPGKIPVIHKPLPLNKLTDFKFVRDKRLWHLYASTENGRPLLSHRNVVFLIAWLVWNDFYSDFAVHMAPNPTSVTVQEIRNLAKFVKERVGVFNISGVYFDSFLEGERITDVVVVINFETQTNFSILFKNQWGELFYQDFNDINAFHAFLKEGGEKFGAAEVHFYIRRSVTFFEKNIERMKKIISHFFMSTSEVKQKPSG